MPASESLTSQEKMTRNLEEMLRKVSTGEIVGLVIVAQTNTGYVLSRRSGEPPPPHGILILQDIADDAKQIFLDENFRPDDGRPRLHAAGDAAGDADEEGAGGEGDSAS